MKGPQVAIFDALFLLRDKCLAEHFLELSLVVQFLDLHQLLLGVRRRGVHHFGCSAGVLSVLTIGQVVLRLG